LVTNSPGDAFLHFWQVGSWLPRPTLPNLKPKDSVWQPSPDGTLYLIWEPKLLTLADAATGKALATLVPPRDIDHSSTNFSSDGTRLAVATGNHTIHVWDLRAIRQGLTGLDLDWELPKYPPPAPPTGESPPTVTVELGIVRPLALALVSLEQKKYFAAAGYYAEAFAARPQLTADVDSPHRYNAACSAALAGCGRGEDAAKLEDPERARLRQQALDWLRADLAAWGQLLDKGLDKTGMAVRTLRWWQQDPDFTGVRGDALAKLPEAERQQWQQLWADVEQTLRNASDKDH
jgi:hypothetical protein